MLQPTASSPDFIRESGPRLRWWAVVSADLGVFCVLALISLVAGLLINAAKHPPLPLVYRTPGERLHATVTRLKAAASPAAPQDGPQALGLDGFQAFALEHRGMVIDARPALIYGQGHVPGAVNLSRTDFDADYRRLGPLLSTRKTDPVAVYCSGADCQDSQLVAKALQELGFKHLFVYTEGWEEWSQTGLPQEK